jgi:hypothetical protein
VPRRLAAAALEELHRAFMFLGRGARGEGPEIPTPSGLAVLPFANKDDIRRI